MNVWIRCCLIPTLGCQQAASSTALRADEGEGNGWSLQSDSGNTALPVYVGSKESICSDTRYIDASGNVQMGKRACDAAPVLCAESGGVGCIATKSYPAAATKGIAGKVLRGEKVAGVAGNVILPAQELVLSGTTYGAPANLQKGTLTLPKPTDVWMGAAPYGDPEALQAPSYSVTIVTRPVAPATFAAAVDFRLDQVTLTWSAVDSAAGYLVLMRKGAPATWTPSDGMLYDAGVMGDAEVLYVGAATTWTHSVPMSGVATYYFAVYSYEDHKIYSAAAASKSVPTCASLDGGTWVRVPGDPIYGTSGFCVMKYIASQNGELPQSKAIVAPWIGISQTVSYSACTRLGDRYHLIQNAEWMTLAAHLANTPANWSGGAVGSGEMPRGLSNSVVTSPCGADASDDLAYTGAGCTNSSVGTFTYRRTKYLFSGDVVWDIGGNAWQWIDLFNLSDKPKSTNSVLEYPALGAGSVSAPKSAFVPKNVVQSWWSDAWSSAQGIGTITPGLNGVGGALLRGGNLSAGSNAGGFGALLNQTIQQNSLALAASFRCAWAP